MCWSSRKFTCLHQKSCKMHAIRSNRRGVFFNFGKWWTDLSICGSHFYLIRLMCLWILAEFSVSQWKWIHRLNKIPLLVNCQPFHELSVVYIFYFYFHIRASPWCVLMAKKSGLPVMLSATSATYCKLFYSKRTYFFQ